LSQIENEHVDVSGDSFSDVEELGGPNIPRGADSKQFLDPCLFGSDRIFKEYSFFVRDFVA
jgi:hypothetical protein